MRTVYRYTIPVDDLPHELAVPFRGDHRFLHVAARTPEAVEVWADVDPDLYGPAGGPAGAYLVTGTGHPVPEDAVYFGTALAPLGLVWHLWRIR